MVGETDLAILLSSMEPKLAEQAYAFVSIKDAKYGDHTDLSPIAAFQEEEGLTLVIPEESANQANLHYSSLFQCISLTIHSSLDAVGLTAAFAEKLASKGISANVIAGFYHDHIFVPKPQAQLALAALLEFQP